MSEKLIRKILDSNPDAFVKGYNLVNAKTGEPFGKPVTRNTTFKVQIIMKNLHDDRVGKWFKYDHLPEGPIRNTSKQFAELANWIINNIEGSAERTVTLRKLLEAKDAGVRSMIETLKNQKLEQGYNEETITDLNEALGENDDDVNLDKIL